MTQMYARQGIEREHRMWCETTERVEIARPPEHGTLSGVRMDNWTYFKLRPDDDAPQYDDFVLRLTGRGGVVQHRIGVEVIPKGVNRPPQCSPFSTAKRSDGRERVVVDLRLSCWDPEFDDFTIHVGGPGEHVSPPIVTEYGGYAIDAWYYRTLATDGDEQTTYWATDSEGGRSADAPISIKVGPSVDRLPECAPTPVEGHQSVFPVYSRPRLPRRFGIHCLDADGDPFEPRIARAPAGGEVAFLEVNEGALGWEGFGRLVDALYVPAGEGTGPDEFQVEAVGPRGVGPPRRLAIVPREPPANDGMGCGTYPLTAGAGVPGVMSLVCSDGDGDPVLMTIVEPPEHGVAGVPVLTPGRYGTQWFSIPYVADPTYRGPDDVTVEYGDGNGYSHRISYRIEVVDPPEVVLPPVEELPVDPLLPWPSLPEIVPDPSGDQAAPGAPGLPPASPPPPGPAVGQAPPVTPRNHARRELATASVRRVADVGPAAVYAPATVRPKSRVKALAVSCAVRCRVHVARSGTRGTRRLDVDPGRARGLAVRLARAELRRLRASGALRMQLRLTVRDDSGAAHIGRVAVTLRAAR